MQQLDENEILAGLQQPETQYATFEKIVKAYSEKLYWMIRKTGLTHDDANDVLQNTFIKAWTNIHQFRGEAKFFTWIAKIAVNENITFINKQRAIHHVSFDDSDSFLLDKLKADPYFDGDQLQVKLQNAILQLPQKQRLVFTMKYYEDMKYEDMSKILGTSVGALKASYFHAVKKIENAVIAEN